MNIEELNKKVDTSFADQKKANDVQAKTNAATEKAIDALTAENKAIKNRLTKLEKVIGTATNTAKKPAKPKVVDNAVTIGDSKYKMKLPSWMDGNKKIIAEAIKGNADVLAEQLEKYPSLFVKQ